MKSTAKTKSAAVSQPSFQPDAFGDLAGLLEAKPSEASGPMMLSLDVIDEDSNQPRKSDNPGFSSESISELAASIKERGVKSPISVRVSPENPDRFVINHGARRFRASKEAGLKTIPAFIDPDYTEADQVVENLQRNELTPREIADWIGRELAAGKKKNAIAQSIGKSPAFVSQHVTLLELPDCIATAFNGGRVRDVTVINELTKAHSRFPTDVEAWLSNDEQEISRGTVKTLRDYLEDLSTKSETDDAQSVEASASTAATEDDVDPEKEPDPSKLKKAIVQIQHDGRPARLVLTKRPESESFGWIKYADDGSESEVDLSTIIVTSIVEG